MNFLSVAYYFKGHSRTCNIFVDGILQALQDERMITIDDNSIYSKNVSRGNGRRDR